MKTSYFSPKRDDAILHDYDVIMPFLMVCTMLSFILTLLWLTVFQSRVIFHLLN